MYVEEEQNICVIHRNIIISHSKITFFYYVYSMQFIILLPNFKIIYFILPCPYQSVLKI